MKLIVPRSQLAMATNDSEPVAILTALEFQKQEKVAKKICKTVFTSTGFGFSSPQSYPPASYNEHKV